MFLLLFRTWLLICIHFLVFPFLSADEEGDPFTSSLVNKQNLLPTTVQSISVMTGEWLESEIDFIVPGHDPLVLTRSYAADYSLGKLGYNWEFNRPNDLIIGIEKNKDKVVHRAFLHHPSGIKTIHKTKDPHRTFSMPLSCTRGLTNCISGEISGKTNLHNISFQVDKKNETTDVISGCGHLTHYKLNKEHLDYLLYSPEYEKKANGNLIIFKNKKIVSKNRDESISYGEISFHPHGREKKVVHASDGTSATYTFDTYNHRKPVHNPFPETQAMPPNPIHSYRYCLLKAEYSHKPKIEYSYMHVGRRTVGEPPCNPFLKKKFVAGHLVQAVTYYQEGENSIQDMDAKINITKNDFRNYRVKEVKAPVGHDKTPIVTHRFIYRDYNAAKHPKTRQTKIYDAYLNKTTYEYNKQHRPISVTRYSKNKKTYSKEHFVWDEREKIFFNRQFDRKVFDLSSPQNPPCAVF